MTAVGKGVRARPAAESPFQSRDVFEQAGLTIGPSVAHVVNVAVQLQDANGNSIAQKAHVRGYLASSATTLAVAAAPDTTAIGTNGLAIVELTALRFTFITDAAGRFDINVTVAAGGTYFLVLLMPDGSIQVSAAIVVT